MIKLGMYFDIQTGTEVEVFKSEEGAGYFWVIAENGLADIIDKQEFDKRYLPTDAITEAANVLFGEDD